MRGLFLSTAAALVLASTMAKADNVVILQDFDLDGIPQAVNNALNAKGDVTGGALEGTNLVNVLQWRDASADAGASGDVYLFLQNFDHDAQVVLNEATSAYGDVGATLAGTNVANLVQIEDRLAGTEVVGDHHLIAQNLDSVSQVVSNKMIAGGKFGSILEGSAMSGTNLGNVASITDVGGGEEYGNSIALGQLNTGVTQTVHNAAAAGSIAGLEMAGTNGVNIAQFDLSAQTGLAEIGVVQATVGVTQTVTNAAYSAGDAANVAMSGINLGNVVTFAAAPAE